MSLLDFPAKFYYRKQYRAALVVYIGAFAINQFDEQTRQRIDSEMLDNLQKSGDGVAAVTRWASWYSLAAMRTAAMQRLGLEPQIKGISLARLLRLNWLYRLVIALTPSDFQNGYDIRADFLANDFRLAGKGTQRAKRFLMEQGIEIPEQMPREPFESDSMFSLPDWWRDTNRLQDLLNKIENKNQ